jgi:integrase
MSIHSYKTKQGKILYKVYLRDGGRSSKQLTKSGFKTKTEAKHWEDEQKVNMRNGYRAVIKANKLGEYLEQWIETKKNEVGESQANRIRQHLKHIIPDLGHLKIDAVTPKHVYDLRTKKKRSEDNPSGLLAPRTVRAMEFCLKGALEDTVGNGPTDLLKMNPLLKLSPLKLGLGDVRAIEVFNVHEQKILIEQARLYASKHDPRWYIRPFIGIHTGLRAGEIAGLWWGDIDWDKNQLRIVRAVHYGKGDTKPVYKETKTKVTRNIFLTKNVLLELKSYRAWVAERLMKVGLRIKSDTPILFDSDLGPLHQTAPMERWTTILRNAGIKYRGFHTLRHTHASNLLTAGHSMKSVSERLGHASIKMTMDTYAHLMEEDHEKEIRILEAIERKIR